MKQNSRVPGETGGMPLARRRAIGVASGIIGGFIVLTAFDYFTNGHHLRFSLINIVIPVIIGILEDMITVRRARKRLARRRNDKNGQEARAAARKQAREVQAKRGTGGNKSKKKKKRKH